MFDLKRLQSFDVETCGKQDLYALQPFRARTGDAWLTTCAMARLGDGGAWGPVDRYRQPETELLRTWLVQAARDGDIACCWNAPFDVAWLIALGLKQEVLQVQWLDGMLLKRHALNEPRYRPGGRISMGLKQTVEQYWNPEAGAYGDDITFNPQTEEEWAKLLHYNGLDAGYTVELVAMFLQMLTPAQRRCALLEARSIPMVAESTVEGIDVNPAAAEALQEKLTNTAAKAFVTLKVSNPEVTKEVLASPKQLGKLLYETWNLPVLKHTEKGQASTDREVLSLLAVNDVRAKHVDDYREANGNLQKFVVSPIASREYNGDGKTRPQARMFGTYTGRMTYSSKTGKGVAEVPSGVALHQWKRDPEFRAILEAPPGYTLLEFDFAGQEFRWMAVESNDETMLSLCMPGEDAHAFMGGRCTGVSYEAMKAGLLTEPGVYKPKRQFGKVANLSCQYRTSARTLVTVAAVQHKIKLTETESQAVWSTYRTTYRAVPKYWRKQVQTARRLGYVETLAGRRVNLGDPSTWIYRNLEDEPDGDASWAHESTAINFPIQGVGADQKYLAMCVLRDYLPRVDGRFAWELHDGLFVVVPDDRADRAVVEIRHLLSNLPYKAAWNVVLPIQFPVDAKRGKSWGGLKEAA